MIEAQLDFLPAAGTAAAAAGYGKSALFKLQIYLNVHGLVETIHVTAVIRTHLLDACTTSWQFLASQLD